MNIMGCCCDGGPGFDLILSGGNTFGPAHVEKVAGGYKRRGFTVDGTQDTPLAFPRRDYESSSSSGSNSWKDGTPAYRFDVDGFLIGLISGQADGSEAWIVSGFDADGDATWFEFRYQYAGESTVRSGLLKTGAGGAVDGSILAPPDGSFPIGLTFGSDFAYGKDAIAFYENDRVIQWTGSSAIDTTYFGETVRVKEIRVASGDTTIVGDGPCYTGTGVATVVSPSNDPAPSLTAPDLYIESYSQHLKIVDPSPYWPRGVAEERKVTITDAGIAQSGYDIFPANGCPVGNIIKLYVSETRIAQGVGRVVGPGTAAAIDFEVCHYLTRGGATSSNIEEVISRLDGQVVGNPPTNFIPSQIVVKSITDKHYAVVAGTGGLKSFSWTSRYVDPAPDPGYPRDLLTITEEYETGGYDLVVDNNRVQLNVAGPGTQVQWTPFALPPAAGGSGRVLKELATRTVHDSTQRYPGVADAYPGGSVYYQYFDENGLLAFPGDGEFASVSHVMRMRWSGKDASDTSVSGFDILFMTGPTSILSVLRVGGTPTLLGTTERCLYFQVFSGPAAERGVWRVFRDGAGLAKLSSSVVMSHPFGSNNHRLHRFADPAGATEIELTDVDAENDPPRFV